MISLTVDNSTCIVRGLNKKQHTDLRLATLYQERTGRWISSIVKDTRTGRPVMKNGKPLKKQLPEIKKHFLMDKFGAFPTGLLHIVEDYLHNSKLKFTYQDARVKPVSKPSDWKHVKASREFQPYPEQVEAAKAALMYGRGIIVGPTGVGKSAIAVEILDAFRVRSLLVVPSLELKRQLTEGLRKVFGSNHVGPLIQGEPEYLITVENVDALDPTKVLHNIDLVIVDEFHHSGAATYRALNKKAWSKVYYKIGLTATPFRSQEAERLLLESVLSHVIYRIEYQTAVDKKYIVPLEAYFVELPTVKVPTSWGWMKVYKHLVVERSDRNQIIADMLMKLQAAEVSTLCLVKQVEHGNAIQMMCDDIRFVKGENDDNRFVIRQFNMREFHGMIGTTGIVGEGVDTKPCEYVIIGGLGKSKNAFMQQVGRGFRMYGDKTSCKIIIFRDKSHKWTDDHYKAQCKYLLEEYGIKPVQLFL